MKAEKKNSSAQSGKIVTRYDKKMEARRLQEEKDRRNAKIAKITGIAVLVLIVVTAAVITVSGITKKNSVMNDTYVMVGDEAVTKHEYDFYYNMYLNQFLTTYSSIISYMGIDTTKDLSTQPYDESRSWKDVFDESAVNEMLNVKALYNDAAANGFEYDTAADYEELVNNVKTNTESSGISVSRYYKLMYGSYATADNVKPYIEENLIADAYYNKLLEDNKPADDEITAYYEENKKYYDKATYYSYAVTASTEEGTDSENETKKAKKTAEEMAERAAAGEDFETLCLEYCTEDERVSYESTDSEFSLTSGSSYSSINGRYSEWLYDSDRKEGDVEVFEDADNLTYYVVKFVSVDYDESCVETISSTLASSATETYVSEITEKYDITDVKGDLKYLTIEEESAENMTEEEAAETESTTETQAQ